MTGSAVQWLRDQLGIISGAAQSESLARQVDDNGGVYFVPAFSGLFAPYWRSDARGAIVGLSRFNTNAHVARATLEAICYQSRDVVDAMEADSGVHLEVLKVDGGITANDLCMQIQADVLGVDVVKPVVAETTALGAAYAAGLAVGFWADPDELRANWHEDKRWTPQWSEEQRADGLRRLAEGRAAHARLGRRRLASVASRARPRLPRPASPAPNVRLLTHRPRGPVNNRTFDAMTSPLRRVRAVSRRPVRCRRRRCSPRGVPPTTCPGSAARWARPTASTPARSAPGVRPSVSAARTDRRDGRAPGCPR